MKWLKHKAAKIIIVALLSAGLVSVGINPKLATVIVSGVEAAFDTAGALDEPVIIKEVNE